MNRPLLTSYVIGNTVTVLAVVIGGLAILYQCWAGELAWGFGLAALVAMSASIKANGQVRSYRLWKQAWDALEDGSTKLPHPATRVVKVVLASLVLGAIVFEMYRQRSDPSYRLALLWLLGVLLVGALLYLIRRWRSRVAIRGETVDPVVSISVRSPLIETPPLSVAFRLLPDHCMGALQPPASDRGSRH